MADRISARRALTNTFFLTLNTARVHPQRRLPAAPPPRGHLAAGVPVDRPARPVRCLVLSGPLLPAAEHGHGPGHRPTGATAAGLAVLARRVDGAGGGQGPLEVLAADPH